MGVCSKIAFCSGAFIYSLIVNYVSMLILRHLIVNTIGVVKTLMSPPKFYK